jgi:glutathione synthase/RimK-type ligase-like ATP-grasp enzyme
MSAADPSNVAERFALARALDRAKRSAEAKAAYLDVLAHDPQHFGAINDLALLLFTSGQRRDAFAVYQEAAARHPENAVAHANLGFMYLKFGDPPKAELAYRRSLMLDPDHAEAQRGLAAALTQQGRGVEVGGASTSALRFHGTAPGVPLLLLVSAGAGNIAAERLIDDTVFATTKLVVELHGDAPLPPHALVFNAIGDVESCGPALAAAARLVGRTRAPVINAPRAVAATSRAANAARLGALAGVRTPAVYELPRAELTAGRGVQALAQRGLGFPVLLRSIGTHTGQHFIRVDRALDVERFAATLPGDSLLAIDFLDTRSADGCWRKYRAMFVGGAMLPLHLAIARQWKVHYFSADMADDAQHRAEEERYLNDPAAVLGPRAMAALGAIRDTLALDYAGVDFTLDAGGEVVVFEANATMVLLTPSADERWAYRRAPIERVFASARAMLQGRAAAYTAEK